MSHFHRPGPFRHSGEAQQPEQHSRRPRRSTDNYASAAPSAVGGLSQHRNDAAAQARRLQLRQARFQTAPLVSTNSSWTSRSSSYNSADELDSPPTNDSRAMKSQGKRLSDDLGILQEISNSSLRRRSLEQEPSEGLETTNGGGPPSDAELDALFEMRDENWRSARQTSAASQRKEAPKTHGRDQRHSRADNANPLKLRKRTATSAKGRRISSNEASKYVEHLESQLAALQSQLQSFMSSSASRTQSAKLRAMNAEAKLLRQELEEWENKFEERIRDYLDDHDTTVFHLKAQVKALERELEASGQRLKDLEDESLDKSQQLMAVESAKMDLEKRIEVMSEMLATSPGKFDFHSSSGTDPRRRSLVRPWSVGPTRFEAFNPLGSPRRSVESPLSAKWVPESPAYRLVRSSTEINPFDQPVVEAQCTESSTEAESEASEVTLVNSTPRSRPGSVFGSEQVYGRERGRPVRRMRRFHSGSTGPRSLILACTTGANSLPVSTSTTASSTPVLDVGNGGEEECSSQFTGEQAIDSSSLESIPTTPESESAANMEPYLPEETDSLATTGRAPANEPTPVIRKITPSIDIEGDYQTAEVGLRVSSFETVPSQNLFEELNLVNCDGYGGAEGDSKPSTVRRRNESSTPKRAPIREETFAKPQAAAKPQAPASARGSTLQRPLGLVNSVLARVSRTLDSSIQPAIQAVASAWSTVTVSRPVLEFRLWLVRLLIGDLEKKGLIVRRPAADRDDGVAALELAPEHPHQMAARHGGPPKDWLQLSVTLLFAVGVVVRDGPTALLHRRARPARA